MSKLGDYLYDMRTRRLLDREIERLLTGAPVELLPDEAWREAVGRFLGTR